VALQPKTLKITPDKSTLYKMDENYLKILKSRLEEKDVSFEAGLTDIEIAGIESFYGFKFPPDLKAFLQFALPVSKNFVNWREETEVEIRERLAWPLDGMYFDIEQNAFWLKEWGPKPLNLDDTFNIARQTVMEAPVLIPIYSHRYIPAEPNQSGNPILSVHQTDIIYYGNDLASYFSHEFNIPCPNWAAKTSRPIKFWDTVMRAWQEEKG
jgi:hypothetical protein